MKLLAHLLQAGPRLMNRRMLAAVGAGLLLTAYVVFLLFAHYASSTTLKRNFSDQFLFEAERHSDSVRYFFTARKDDVEELAASRAVSAYFENRALGMSMRYGLAASIDAIEKQFANFISLKRFGAEKIYARIELTDLSGAVLAEAGRRGPAAPAGAPSRSSAVAITQDGKMSYAVMPFYFKGRLAGRIIAWIRPEMLTRQLAAAGRLPRWLVLLVYEGREQAVVAGASPPITSSLPPAYLRALTGLPLRTVSDVLRKEGTGRQPVVAVRVPVVDAPFSLLTAAPAEDVYGTLSPRRSFFALLVLALAILGGAGYAIILNTKYLVLQEHLDEARRREIEISEKNRQLEVEIADRKRAEAERRKSEDRFRTLFNNANDTIFIHDLEGRFLEVNAAACDRLGYRREEFSLMTLRDVLAPEFLPGLQDRLDQVRRQGQAVFESAHRTRNGLIIPVEVNTGAFEYEGWTLVLSVARDLSERKKTEEEIIRSQKLESVGVLAGGIAHDFNNLLTTIMGNVSLAMLDAEHDERVIASLQAAERATLRARDLTQQLLTFSKGGEPIRKILSLKALIRESADLVLRGADVVCQFEFPEELWAVEADEGQISQVIHNLVLNADQAMPGGGVIDIQCRNVTVQGGEAQQLPPGRYVEVSVRDFGVGIPPEYLTRIFDPYFTTKKKGTGLGLATAYSIVKRHQGRLTVRSEAGVGSVFTMLLPAAAHQPAKPRERAQGALRGTGRVLIMDDEASVLATAAAILERLGYDVVRARDGQEAIDQYALAFDSERGFDVVILDLTVPGGMGGAEALTRIREIDPAVRAIVSSGYSNDPILGNYGEYGFAGIIAKPYRATDLSAAVLAVLNGTP